MNPIFIILYAVIVTLLLTIFFPRLRKANPQLSWILLIAGALGFIAIMVIALTR